MNQIAIIFRIREWIASEIPILFIFIYSNILLSHPDSKLIIVKGISWIIFTCIILAFSYAINDFSDMEVDKIAGKGNGMSNLTSVKRVVILTGLMFAGILIILPWEKNCSILSLVIIMFFTGFSYSMPPFRFKEKGVLGLLFSGIGQRTLPLILGTVLFSDFSFQNCVLIILFTAVGVRWIIVHQLNDFENDRKARVVTFVTKYGYLRAEFIMKWILFPLELTALILWFYLFLKFELWGLLVIGIYLVWIGIQWSLNLQQPLVKWKVFGLLPFTHLYSFFWPFILGILATISEPNYFLFILFQLLLHGTYLFHKCKIGFTKNIRRQTILDEKRK